MLGDKRLITTVPVADVDRARGFYEGVLGLNVLGGPLSDGSLEYEAGGGARLATYPTQDNAGKSPATLAGWEVDDVESTVRELRQKGVVFEDYDLPGLKTEGGIATLGDQKGGWFKDPDGNILAVFQRG